MKRERQFSHAAHLVVCSETELRIDEWLDSRQRRKKQVGRNLELAEQFALEVHEVLRRSYLRGDGLVISDSRMGTCFRRAKKACRDMDALYGRVPAASIALARA